MKTDHSTPSKIWPAVVTGVLVPIAVADAERFSRVIVFGDSFSDSGNMFELSNGMEPELPAYHEGRFSNGPVWVEYLAELITLPSPEASLLGGANYAFGGAVTGALRTRPPGLENQPLRPGMGIQVQDFLRQQVPQSGDLFVLYGGYNDLEIPDLRNPQQMVDNLAAQVRTLYNAGAEHFLVGNLIEGGDKLQDRQKFNQLWEAQAAELHNELPIQVLFYDIADLTNEIFENPRGWGLTQIWPPSLDLDSGNVMRNPEETYCWDNACRPTTRVHRVYAQEAYARVLSFFVGDYDADGVLDAADVDILTEQIRTSSTNTRYDTNLDGMVDAADRAFWIHDLFGTYFGDANLDGEFNNQDLVQVMQAAEYEDGVPMNSVWSTGDWDGTGEFESADLILAFQDGGYQRGQRPAVNVPEPTGAAIFLANSFVLLVCRVGRRPAA